MNDKRMSTTFKTVKVILEEQEAFGEHYTEFSGRCPLDLSVIPNHMGINLCSVHSVSWTRQPDGQLVNLTVNFIPATETEKAEQGGRWNSKHADQEQAVYLYSTCPDLGHKQNSSGCVMGTTNGTLRVGSQEHMWTEAPEKWASYKGKGVTDEQLAKFGPDMEGRVIDTAEGSYCDSDGGHWLLVSIGDERVMLSHSPSGEFNEMEVIEEEPE